MSMNGEVTRLSVLVYCGIYSGGKFLAIVVESWEQLFVVQDVGFSRR
jgi:hypothetical protein